jgi:hypothetical protein
VPRNTSTNQRRFCSGSVKPTDPTARPRWPIT